MSRSEQQYVELKEGERVGDYAVDKQIGEGAYGYIYLVREAANRSMKAAMKVEPRMPDESDEILKMEVYVLNQLKDSKHVCKIYAFGRKARFKYAPFLLYNAFSWVAMQLLGRDIEELRRRQPNRVLSHATTIKTGIQVTQALRDIHRAGFVHRDVKPANLAINATQQNLIHIIDFGLARQILVKNAKGERVLREPRSKVMFRGTMRYCSLGVHDNKEPGRHDDLWGLLYVLVELATGTLPWKAKERQEAIILKRMTKPEKLFKVVFANLTKV